MEFFAIFVSRSKKEKTHGFSNRERSCKSDKCRKVWIFRHFFGLDADEVAEDFYLKQGV